MGVQIAEGVFNVGLGTGNVSVTGLMGGAQVTALKVWCNGRTAAGVARGSIQFGTGITDGTNQACIAGFDQDVGTTKAKSGATDDALIWTLDNTGATDGVAVLVSLDAGGFTVNVTDAFSADLEIHYLAWSGRRAKVVRTANEPATAIASSTTGVGFKGKVANIIGAGSLTSYAAGKQTGADYNLFDGWAVVNPSGTLRQGVMANGADDNVATTSTRQYFRSSAEVLACFDATASATPKCRAAFNSFDSDGFTLGWNVVVGAGTRNYFALVLEGVTAELQQFTTSVTGGATFTVTPGFKALGGYVSHGGRSAESTAGTGNAVGRFLLGAFVGTGSNHALGSRSSNAAAGGLCTTESNAGNCVVNLNDGALSGAANVTAISATQVTWTMSTGDSAACFGFAVTFGDDLPPYTGRQLDVIRQSWEPADPTPTARSFPPPQAVAPAADQFPRPPRIDALVASWQPTEPAPFMARSFPQAAPAPSADQSPRSARTDAIVAAWQPTDPAPWQPRYSPPPSAAAPVADVVLRAARIDVIRASWETTDPQPQPARTLPPPAPGGFPRPQRIDVIRGHWDTTEPAALPPRKLPTDGTPAAPAFVPPSRGASAPASAWAWQPNEPPAVAARKAPLQSVDAPPPRPPAIDWASFWSPRPETVPLPQKLTQAAAPFVGAAHGYLARIVEAWETPEVRPPARKLTPPSVAPPGPPPVWRPVARLLMLVDQWPLEAPLDLVRRVRRLVFPGVVVPVLAAPLFAVFDDVEYSVDFDEVELIVDFDDNSLTVDFDE